MRQGGIMAKLYFRYGAMGSSKSSNALMVNFNYYEKGQKCLLLKPGLDKRDGIRIIASRIGLSSECELVEDIMDEKRGLFDERIKNCEFDAIIVDEAQFLKQWQVDIFTDIVDYLNIPVICYGLRTDFQGNLFEGSKALMQLADNIEEIKTICWCGRKATNNARYNEDGIVRQGEQVVLGANDKYISLCRKHWKEGKLTRDS